jgi:L-threonylcarbamoyladenylate synthase
MPVVPATEEAIRQAAQALVRGEIVAFPTETVYGLGANALDPRTVAKVFAAKERPRFNPLIVHVPDLAAAELYAVMNGTARLLAEAFWPGPLSLVLQKRPACGIADLVSAGLDTIALRAPAHPVAQALLAEVKLPIAAPSANRSGQEPGLLRPGALSREAIELVLGRPLATAKTNHRGASPGQLAIHYAPATPLRLNVTRPEAGDALLAFGPDTPDFDGPTRNLSHHGDLNEAAAKLFAALRELDQMGATAIAVMPIPAHGLGEAINDRLQRAANRG